MRDSKELLDVLHGRATDRADGSAEQGDEPQSSPYKLFFHALEELEDNRLLYGPGSVEASIARARVSRLRELATDTWRSAQAA